MASTKKAGVTAGDGLGGAGTAGRGNETVALRLAGAFRRHGVEIVFGQSIPTAFHLAAPQVGIRQAAYRAENAGGAMADGYARASNRVGVVTGQNGPAATLLVAPLAEALKASIPIVALVQEVARGTADRNAFQELDHLRLFDGAAKWVRRVDQAERVEDYVDMAFAAATGGRPGPAVLLVPIDLLNDAATTAQTRTASFGHYPLDRTAPDPVRVAEAASLLAGARAPLIIAGGGVHASEACEALAALQDQFHLPVATTVMGKGAVAETHPLSLGVVGYVMGEGARTQAMRKLVSEADVVLLVGNRTNQNGTDSWSLYPRNARYIQIDIDPSEIGRNYEAVRLAGDARLALEALAAAMRKLDVTRRKAARPAVEAAIKEGLGRWEKLTRSIRSGNGTPIRPERVMAVLESLIDPETIMVADASYSSIWITNYMTARKPGQRFLTPRGMAGLGWGLPMAIGAQMACPGRRVVCVGGDGGFAHCWAELETLRRLELPVIMIVLNNQILGYQKDAEDVRNKAHTDAVYFQPVDHAAIARACGIQGIRIGRGEEIEPVLKGAVAANVPVLIDVITDPEARPPITAFEGRFSSPF